MAKEKIRMPAGTAGLVRYFEEYREAIQIKPEHVVVMIVLTIALVIFARFYFVL